MSDPPARRTNPSPDGARPSPPRSPGWRVTPAPDGRGGATGDRPSSPMPPRSRWWIALVVVGLLALNLWISSRALQPNAPVRVPYSPTFLTQVKDGNVKEISSTGDSIQGTFKNPIRYPAGDKNVEAKSNFSTQIPSFADNSELSSLLQGKGVT